METRSSKIINRQSIAAIPCNRNEQQLNRGRLDRRGAGEGQSGARGARRNRGSCEQLICRWPEWRAGAAQRWEGALVLTAPPPSRSRRSASLHG
jgi:hypothetical protein